MYPIRCTQICQVCDTVFNGPFKAEVRLVNIEATLESFELHKERLASGEVDVPKYALPKPDIKKAIDNYFKIMTKMSSNQTLRTGIQRGFISTGSAPKEDGSYVEYSATAQFASKGLAIIPMKSSAQPVVQAIIEAADNLDEDEEPDDIIMNENEEEIIENEQLDMLEELQFDIDPLLDDFFGENMYDSDSDVGSQEFDEEEEVFINESDGEDDEDINEYI